MSALTVPATPDPAGMLALPPANSPARS